MPVHGEGDLELGAHPIGGADQHGLAMLLHIQCEEAAEAAHLAQHLAPVRGGEQLGQRALDLVAQINVHPGGGVSFLFHASGAPDEEDGSHSGAWTRIFRNPPVHSKAKNDRWFGQVDSGRRSGYLGRTNHIPANQHAHAPLPL